MGSLYKTPGSNFFASYPASLKEITYDDARNVKSDEEKISYLQYRIDYYLIKQVKPFGERNKDLEPKIWAPFPLTMLTLLTIETLGRIIKADAKSEVGPNEGILKIYTRPIYQLIDTHLNHCPTKSFFQSYEKRYGNQDKQSIKHYSDIMQKYLRNNFMHGFQGTVIGLDHKYPNGWYIDEKQGTITLNPYWLWDRCYNVYEDIFTNIATGKKKYIECRKNALIYYDKLLE